MTNNDIERAFKVSHKFGLHTSAFVMIGLPHEEKSDMVETMDLLARIQPGRIRWSLFFPFIGTKAYDIAKKANQIDFDKMGLLDNFTDETCMMLGEEEDLFVNKLKAMFCLFLNGYADMDGQQKYAGLVREVEAATAEDWHENKDLFMERIKVLDKEMEENKKCFYTIKYNAFMGVRSDWEDDSISA
jgi:anaerobic magnesium-protoporphyrin IX monomethyl ester cyclase